MGKLKLKVKLKRLAVGVRIPPAAFYAAVAEQVDADANTVWPVENEAIPKRLSIAVSTGSNAAINFAMDVGSNPTHGSNFLCRGSSVVEQSQSISMRGLKVVGGSTRKRVLVIPVTMNGGGDGYSPLPTFICKNNRATNV